MIGIRRRPIAFNVSGGFKIWVQTLTQHFVSVSENKLTAVIYLWTYYLH